MKDERNMNKRFFEQVVDVLAKNISTAETELKYTNPFTLLVAVVLSAQSTDVGVNKATQDLFKIASSPGDIINLGIDRLVSHVKTLNYYNTKAKNVLALSHMLADEFGGQVPQTREELVRLPGVGRKTANVVLNVAFNQPTIPVDTHVMRVAQRLGFTKHTRPEKVEADLEQLAEGNPHIHKIHHLFILHGRYTCKARKPLCAQCPLAAVCPNVQAV